VQVKCSSNAAEGLLGPLSTLLVSAFALKTACVSPPSFLALSGVSVRQAAASTVVAFFL